MTCTWWTSPGRREHGLGLSDPNPGVGPVRVAELRAMFLDGTLGAYCDSVWRNVTTAAA